MSAEPDYLQALLPLLLQPGIENPVQLLSDAAQAHPADPRPLLLLAAHYAHAQDFDRAEGCYIEALLRAPDFAIARFQLGLLQFSSARPATALATFAPLDQLPDGHPLRLFKNAFDCLAVDQLQEARRWLVQGMANNHDNPPLNLDMQKIVSQIDRVNAATGNGSAAAPSSPLVPGTSTEVPAAPQVEEHFLVSAYRNLH